LRVNIEWLNCGMHTLSLWKINNTCDDTKELSLLFALPKTLLGVS